MPVTSRPPKGGNLGYSIPNCSAKYRSGRPSKLAIWLQIQGGGSGTFALGAEIEAIQIPL